MFTLKRRQLCQIGVAASTLPLLMASTSSSGQETSNTSWASRKKKVTIRGLEMAYIDEGTGDPIVFLHGNPTSSYLWRNIIPHVQHLGRCIAPDMIGMGDSDPLPDSGPGKYTLPIQRDYLFEMLEAIGVAEEERVTLVIHDWGSAMGFMWAQKYPDKVKGICFMESIFLMPDEERPAPSAGPFAIFRSDAGEEAVLQNNMFIEDLLITGMGHYISEADRTEYRKPYLQAGESRRPTLTWPREIVFEGQPAVNAELIHAYSNFIANDNNIEKLFIRGIPGTIISDEEILTYVRSFNRLKEETVYGTHYLQEMAPDAIGRALLQWMENI